jgi:hypothetical protein
MVKLHMLLACSFLVNFFFHSAAAQGTSNKKSNEGGTLSSTRPKSAARIEPVTSLTATGQQVDSKQDAAQTPQNTSSQWANPRLLSNQALKSCLSNSQTGLGLIGPFNFSNPGLESHEIICQKAAFVLRSDGVDLDPVFAFSTSNGLIYGTWKEFLQGVYFPPEKILDAWGSGLDQAWGIERGNYKGAELSFKSRADDIAVVQFSATGRGDGLVFDPKNSHSMHAVWYDAPILFVDELKKPVSGLISIYVRSKDDFDHPASRDAVLAAKAIFESLRFSRSETKRLSDVEYKKLAPRIRPGEQQPAGGNQGATASANYPSQVRIPTDASVGADQFKVSVDLLSTLLKLKSPRVSEDPAQIASECSSIHRLTKASISGFDYSEPTLLLARNLCSDLIQWVIIQNLAGDKSDTGVYRYLLGAYAAAVRMQRLWSGSDAVRNVLTDFRAYSNRLYAARGQLNPFEKFDVPPLGHDQWFHAQSELFLNRHQKGSDWELWVTRDPVCIGKEATSVQGLRKLGVPNSLWAKVHDEEKALVKKLEGSTSIGSGCAYFTLDR